VAGTTADTVLGVTAPYFIDVWGKGPRLLFLKRASDGTYEVVRFGGGSLSLRGRSVQRLGLDVDSVAKRVHQLKLARRRSGGVK